MTNELIDTRIYQTLRDDLAALLRQGTQDAMNTLNEIRLKTYWTMGQRMNTEKGLLDPSQSARFFNQLETDLNLDKSLLYRILQLYQTWPDGIPKVENRPTLSWGHFAELLSIKDAVERNFYLETAGEEEWARDTLRKAIAKDVFTTSQNETAETKPMLLRDTNPLYTYKAVIERVIDGDTLLAHVDLGFHVWTSQRLRLRGINTEELNDNVIASSEGAKQSPDRAEQAKQFVEEKLSHLEFVVIKTYRTDKYGRYVADIFYHPTLQKKEEIAEKGFFLNQQLLDAGLADRMI